jgi:uncharacterized protein (TIGR03083 family)
MMDNMTTTKFEDVTRIERPESVALAEAETERMASMLRSLEPDDWSRPTDCPLWDVRAMAGHVLGMTQTFTGLRRMFGDMQAGGKRAKKDGVEFIDGLTAVQVDQSAALSSDQLVARLDEVGPAAARWRGRRRLLRHMPMKQPMPDGTTETWRMGYLVDVILTRDTWMHRVDVARATGKPLELTGDHDGRIVADAAAEWAGRHGQPCTLHLTGPAGGTFTQGEGGETITIDAVEFCRILSGRGAGDGLLAQAVPF